MRVGSCNARLFGNIIDVSSLACLPYSAQSLTSGTGGVISTSLSPTTLMYGSLCSLLDSSGAGRIRRYAEIASCSPEVRALLGREILLALARLLGAALAFANPAIRALLLLAAVCNLPACRLAAEARVGAVSLDEEGVAVPALLDAVEVASDGRRIEVVERGVEGVVRPEGVCLPDDGIVLSRCRSDDAESSVR